MQELCLYLDEERGGVASCGECGGPASLAPAAPPHLQPRDEGDGSSSSTNNDDR